MSDLNAELAGTCDGLVAAGESGVDDPRDADRKPADAPLPAFTTIPAVVSDLPNDTTTWGAVGGVGIKHRTKHRYADRARSARSARAAVPSTRRGPGRRRPGAASMPVGLPAHPREVC
jgi:hypothetical protein